MLRAIVGAIGFIWVFSAEAASQTPDPNPGLINMKTHTVETAKAARIEVCLDDGGSFGNCECRADTASKIISEEDFLLETLYIEMWADALVQEHANHPLHEFRKRLLDEQPDMMMRLGQALADCPVVRMRLE